MFLFPVGLRRDLLSTVVVSRLPRAGSWVMRNNDTAVGNYRLPHYLVSEIYNMSCVMSEQCSLPSS